MQHRKRFDKNVENCQTVRNSHKQKIQQQYQYLSQRNENINTSTQHRKGFDKIVENCAEQS